MVVERKSYLAGRYLVLEENDADKAHQSARNFRPDLILLDINMPQRDGGDIAAQIDADPGFHRTPIVFSPRWSRKPMQKPGHREHLYAMDVGRGITQILLSNGCRYAKKDADLRPFEVNCSCAFRSLPDNCWKCSGIPLLTISAKPVGVGAVAQRLIPTGERSSLQTRIAVTVNASLCARMKS